MTRTSMKTSVWRSRSSAAPSSFADAVILWWREDDGDLIDALVDGLTNLAEGGFIVLFTPKAGRDGFVDASDIQEAALTAGLHASGSANAARDWNGSRLVAPKSARR
jgi:hypothetical protein